MRNKLTVEVNVFNVNDLQQKMSRNNISGKDFVYLRTLNPV